MGGHIQTIYLFTHVVNASRQHVTVRPHVIAYASDMDACGPQGPFRIKPHGHCGLVQGQVFHGKEMRQYLGSIVFFVQYKVLELDMKFPTGPGGTHAR